MTGQQIYDLFKVHVDDEEFNSDDAAIAAMNAAYRKILSERDWEFLKKTVLMPRGMSSLATITDLDTVIRVWAQTGSGSFDFSELEKSSFDKRFTGEGDYYIDYVTKSFVYLHGSEPVNWLGYAVDYKYRPADLDLESTPVWPEEYHSLLAYEMVRAYKEGDLTYDFYKEVGYRYEDVAGNLARWNDQLCLETK